MKIPRSWLSVESFPKLIEVGVMLGIGLICGLAVAVIYLATKSCH